MRDLTQFGNSELSLIVFNDEYFYSERGNREYLLALIKEEFIYTPDQLEELITDLDDDEKENE